MPYLHARALLDQCVYRSQYAVWHRAAERSPIVSHYVLPGKLTWGPESSLFTHPQHLVLAYVRLRLGVFTLTPPAAADGMCAHCRLCPPSTQHVLAECRYFDAPRARFRAGVHALSPSLCAVFDSLPPSSRFRVVLRSLSPPPVGFYWGGILPLAMKLSYLCTSDVAP